MAKWNTDAASLLEGWNTICISRMSSMISSVVICLLSHVRNLVQAPAVSPGALRKILKIHLAKVELEEARFGGSRHEETGDMHVGT